jgi:glutamine synthetase
VHCCRCGTYRFEITMSAQNVLKLIKDNDVEFVDLRFADMLGKQHHVTFPAHSVDESLFEDGKMFDGSSIARLEGHQRVRHGPHARPDTAVIDPFFERHDADHPLRRARAGDDAGLRARSRARSPSAPRRT